MSIYSYSLSDEIKIQPESPIYIYYVGSYFTTKNKEILIGK